MLKWEQGHTWQQIAVSYLSYVQCLGRYAENIIVVFDGYGNSPKDHDHMHSANKELLLWHADSTRCDTFDAKIKVPGQNLQ